MTAMLGNRYLGMRLRVRALIYFLLAALTCFAASGLAQQPAQSGTSALSAANQLVQAYNARNQAAALRIINMDALAARTAATMFDRAADRDGFVRGFAGGGGRLVGSQFQSLDRAKGSVKFMRLIPHGNQTGALVRFDMGDSGFDYVEWLMERDANGAMRVVDWDSLMNGEMFSVTLGAITKLMLDPNPGMLERLFGIKQPNAALVEQFKRIGERQRANDVRGALAQMEQLPREINDSWTISKLRVSLAAQVGDDPLYRKQLSRLAQLHGDNPRSALILIDHHFYNGDFAQVLRTIGVLEKRVGVDGMTRLLRANAHLSSKNYDLAVAEARESIKLEPKMEAPYWVLPSAHIGAGRFADAVDSYKGLATQFGYAFSLADFAAKPEYANFIKSKEFKAWLPQ